MADGVTSTPTLDRLHSAAVGAEPALSSAAAHRVVFAVLAELVQTTDEADESTIHTTIPLDHLGQDFIAAAGARIGVDPRPGILRVLERLVEPQPTGVTRTILGRTGWEATALRALYEATQTKAEPDTSADEIANLTVKLRALIAVPGTHEEERIAAEDAARAISQLAKQHADDAYKTHLSLVHHGTEIR